MSHRVRIGTCSSPADAALVRSLFSAHGIAVVVGAEHHASLFGTLGSSFLSLDLWVDQEDSEEAAALLRDLRERDDSSDGDGHDGDGDGDDGDDRDDATREPGAPAAARDRSTSSVQLRIDRRRRTGVVLLLGCLLTFGTAHMFTRAWVRGIVLAAIEISGFLHLGRGRAIGGVAVAAAILTDLIGALWRIRAAPRPALPVARVL